jgi:hypothetical protein
VKTRILCDLILVATDFFKKSGKVVVKIKHGQAKLFSHSL